MSSFKIVSISCLLKTNKSLILTKRPKISNLHPFCIIYNLNMRSLSANTYLTVVFTIEGTNELGRVS